MAELRPINRLISAEAKAVQGYLGQQCYKQTICCRIAASACTSSEIRRNDDVVRGYLELIPLTAAELGCLDDLWRAAVLRYALQIHDGDLAIENQETELQWCVKQLEKTVPFDDDRG